MNDKIKQHIEQLEELSQQGTTGAFDNYLKQFAEEDADLEKFLDTLYEEDKWWICVNGNEDSIITQVDGEFFYLKLGEDLKKLVPVELDPVDDEFINPT